MSRAIGTDPAQARQTAAATHEPSGSTGLSLHEMAGLRSEFVAFCAAAEGGLDVGGPLRAELPMLAQALRADMTYDQLVSQHRGYA